MLSITILKIDLAAWHHSVFIVQAKVGVNRRHALIFPCGSTWSWRGGGPSGSTPVPSALAWRLAWSWKRRRQWVLNLRSPWVWGCPNSVSFPLLSWLFSASLPQHTHTPHPLTFTFTPLPTPHTHTHTLTFTLTHECEYVRTYSWGNIARHTGIANVRLEYTEQQ